MNGSGTATEEVAGAAGAFDSPAGAGGAIFAEFAPADAASAGHEDFKEASPSMFKEEPDEMDARNDFMAQQERAWIQVRSEVGQEINSSLECPAFGGPQKDGTTCSATISGQMLSRPKKLTIASAPFHTPLTKEGIAFCSLRPSGTKTHPAAKLLYGPASLADFPEYLHSRRCTCAVWRNRR